MGLDDKTINDDEDAVMELRIAKYLLPRVRVNSSLG
jgi:hypothetical protein